MMLALGLNVVVGWGGLLDLGFVAFYGIGAYAYALLDSDHYGIHMWSVLSIPIVVIIGGVAGFLLGLPSRRLSGDYLAIVTLFFLQLFQTLTTNGDQFLFGAGNVTGGANGILRIDPLDLFGKELAIEHNGEFAVGYYFVALAFFAVVFVLLRLVNHSRTGRAWRSQREDALAAEVMGMPVNWLKLMSFAFGAATAALTGTLFASANAAVFPLEFYFVLLITVYTMVILGGQGSQAGVVLGAIFGFALRAIADAIDHKWVSGSAGGWASDWVIVPVQTASWIAPVTYIGLIAAVLGLTLVRGWVRTALLVPVLYLAAFVWENVMLVKPEPTRYIVIGVILVALMVLRPNGLLGERRVEIL
jgi:branched-chain amino acid transport system permease protein